MSKRTQRRKRMQEMAPVETVETAQPTRPAVPTAFTFGEPQPMDRASLLDYTECVSTGRWYEPPISPEGLAGAFKTAPHHSSAIYVKRNMLVATYVPHPALAVDEFGALCLDYLTFGNAYLEEERAVSGRLMRLRRSPAKFTRRGLKPRNFWFVPYTREAHEFQTPVVHLKDCDVNQEVYGVPEYLSALHSAQLNKSATLFRRKYYDNGSHAGFILYMSDPAQDQQDVDAMRDALRKSKGPGNFRNLFMYSPNGKKDGIQLIPISEVSARDNFADIKNISRDDVLAAHRVPPQLLGVVPDNAGGFGDVEKAEGSFYRLEVKPLQVRMQALNAMLGVEVIRFRDPVSGKA